VQSNFVLIKKEHYEKVDECETKPKTIAQVTAFFLNEI